MEVNKFAIISGLVRVERIMTCFDKGKRKDEGSKSDIRFQTKTTDLWFAEFLTRDWK